MIKLYICTINLSSFIYHRGSEFFSVTYLYCVNDLSYLCHVKCIVSLFMEQSIDPFFILGIHREYNEGGQTRTETTYSYGKPDPLIRSTASHIQIEGVQCWDLLWSHIVHQGLMFVDLVDKPYIFHEFCPNERITKKRIVKHYNATNQKPTKLYRPRPTTF